MQFNGCSSFKNCLLGCMLLNLVKWVCFQEKTTLNFSLHAHIPIGSSPKGILGTHKIPNAIELNGDVISGFTTTPTHFKKKSQKV